LEGDSLTVEGIKLKNNLTLHKLGKNTVILIIIDKSVMDEYHVRTEGLVQAVELLLCKHKALSSNPSSTKKKRLKKTHTTS
jgi:hypothetical protein